MKNLLVSAVALGLLEQSLPVTAFTAPALGNHASVGPSISTPRLPMQVDGWNDWMLDSGSQAHDFDGSPYPRRQQYFRKGSRPFEYDYDKSMDKQADLWIQQQVNEDFIENPYGRSGYGQYYREQTRFDEYDRENLYHDITPKRQPQGMARHYEVMRKQHADDAFISNPYGNRPGPGRSW